MLRQVTLERFRGFAELTAVAGPITALLGPNSSGKTSVLQAIRIACDAARMLLTIGDDPQIKGDEIQVSRSEAVVTDPAQLVGLVDWTQLITDGAVGDGVFSRIQLEFESTDPITRLETRLVYGRNAQLKIASTVVSPRTLEAVAGFSPKSQQRAPRLREELERWLPVAVFIPPFYGVIRTEEYRTDPVIRRALVQGDQSHIVRNLLARLDGLSPVNDFLRRTIGNGAEVVGFIAEAHRNQHAALEAHYRDTNGRLELSTAGAGLTSLIATASALEWTAHAAIDGRTPTRMFLFDEPEAHLHPRLQGETGVRTAEAVRRYGAQMLLATHSVEMINRLGRLSETVLLHVDRGLRRATPLTSDNEVIAALSAFCDLTPYTAINFLASRAVLFHEGPSDWKILNACAEALFAKDPQRLARWRQITHVSVDGVANAGLSTVTKRLVTPEVFPALEDGKEVMVAVVRDRDAIREPRAAVPVRDQHAIEIDVVWSRNSIESIFLDAGVLHEWLVAFLGEPAIDQLTALCERGIEAANGDHALNADAKRLLIDAETRPSAPLAASTTTPADSRRSAFRDAEREVSVHPEIWQKGRDRARKVLSTVHDALPTKRAAAFPVDLARIIAESAPDRLRDLGRAIPEEVQKLLLAMTDTMV